MRRTDEKTASQATTPQRAGARGAAPSPVGVSNEATPGQHIPTLSFSLAAAPSVALPKGGGALRGIGEKFQVSAATGTGSLAVPVPLSPTRAALPHARTSRRLDRRLHRVLLQPTKKAFAPGLQEPHRVRIENTRRRDGGIVNLSTPAGEDQATGREHAGGIGDDQRDNNDMPLWSLPHANDAQALRNYVEQYQYDFVGNIEKMIHTAVGSAVGSWTRRYAYGDAPFPNPPPQTPPVPENNRLHSTSLPGDPAAGPYSATYSHDANGNMLSMPHLASMTYSHRNQMREADLGGGGTAYYTYDASGERVRKVIQRLGTTREERIYLGGWELYRKRQGAGAEVVLEWRTVVACGVEDETPSSVEHGPHAED